MLLILSMMIEAFEHRLQSKGYDYDEQSGDEGEVKTKKAERYMSGTSYFLQFGCLENPALAYNHEDTYPKEAPNLIIAHCPYI